MTGTPASTTLRRFAMASIAAAIITILLKTLAWWLTGSVGLLSDALESLVNLFAAMFALGILQVAAQPADEAHAYGHAKAEYFAAGTEGGLIILAAATISWSAVDRLLHPAPIEHVGVGLAVSIIASFVNLGVGLWLVRVGRHHRSVTLEADGKHLLTDVWTSAGVVVGVVAVVVTGIERLDPVIALAVAAHIVWTGAQLVRRAMLGLMDTALTGPEMEAITTALEQLRERGFDYHALRTRIAGRQSFMSVHVLVPGSWTVQQGHELIDEFEENLYAQVPGLTVVTHLEPIEDERSFRDTKVRR